MHARMCQETLLAWEWWLAQGDRTPTRLAALVHHYCTVYGRDRVYTACALDEARVHLQNRGASLGVLGHGEPVDPQPFLWPHDPEL